MKNITTNFRYDINGLRAWAVISVMLYHFNVSLFNGGFIGVDIFFVISGFLMTKIIMTGMDNHKFSLINFYLARAKRIIPALVVFCIITLLAGWLILATSEYKKMARSVIAAITFTSNILFKSQFNYFDDIANNQWLLHTWSLSIEWQFYLFLPIFLLVCTKLVNSKHVVNLLLLLTLISLTLCLHKVYKTNPHITSAFYTFYYRAWEMLAGGLVWAIFFHKTVTIKYKKTLEYTGFLLIILSVVLINKHILWPSLYTIIPVFAACLIIIANRQSSLLTNNYVCQWLGNNSYSIYLYHWLVMMTINHLGFKENSFIIMLGIFLSVILGQLSYRWVEIPAKQYFSNKTFKIDLLAYAIVLALFVVTGYAIRDKYLLPLVSYRMVNYDYYGVTKQISVNDIKSAGDDWDYPSGLPPMTINGVEVYGVMKEKNTLFYGDSNTEQYSSRIKKLTDNNSNRGALFLTNPTCASVAAVDWDNQYDNCRNATKNLLRLLEDKRIDRVVISTLFTQYLISRNDKFSIAGVKLSDKAAQQQYFSQFEDLISKLSQLNKQVYLVKTIPTGMELNGLSLVKYKKGHLIFNLQPIPKQRLLTERQFINDQFEIFKEKYHITLIDPLDYLCDQDNCWFIDEQGHIMYRDYCHLKSSYAQKYVTYLDNTMN